MINLLLAIIILLILLILAVQTLSFRFTYIGEAVIDIDFLLFEFILYPSRKRTYRKRGKQKQNKYKSNFLKKFKSAKKAADYILSHSQIVVNKLSFTTKAKNPADFVLKSQNISSLVLIMLTYFYIHADSLIQNDGDITVSAANASAPPMTDITLKTKLITPIFAFFRFTAENVYQEIRR